MKDVDLDVEYFGHVWWKFEFAKDADGVITGVNSSVFETETITPHLLDPFYYKSLVVVYDDNKDGGSDQDSMDPNDWVAFWRVLLLSATFPNSGSSPTDPTYWQGTMTTTTSWSDTFTYNGTTYTFTVPAGAAYVNTRSLYIGDTVDEDGNKTGEIWEKCYDFGNPPWSVISE